MEPRDTPVPFAQPWEGRVRTHRREMRKNSPSSPGGLGGSRLFHGGSLPHPNAGPNTVPSSSRQAKIRGVSSIGLGRGRSSRRPQLLHKEKRSVSHETVSAPRWMEISCLNPVCSTGTSRRAYSQGRTQREEGDVADRRESKRAKAFHMLMGMRVLTRGRASEN